MSQTNLNDLKKHIEDVITELGLAYNESEILISEAKNAEERRITKNKDQEDREKKIIADGRKLNEERAYLVQVRDSQKVKEIRLANLEEQEKKMKDILVEIDEKKREVAGEMEKLNAKRKDLEYINLKMEEMKKEQVMMEKEKALDRQRKELLDQREKRITETEQRLQRMM